MEEKQETFHKIMREWARKKSHYRAGQALFNAVLNCDEYTANEMRAKPMDPFFDDSRIPAAISWLAERYFG